ncbi:MAG: SAM-dependent methyltransferase [Halieaceae bacterium]|jgi:SAM-dependent methyltransferase
MVREFLWESELLCVDYNVSRKAGSDHLMDRQFIEFSARLESWYASLRGRYLARVESSLINRELEECFGYNLLQLGPGRHPELCSGSRVKNHFYLSPGTPTQAPDVYADYGQLPFESGSIDVAVVHHVLEWSQQPHQLLRELQRVVAPQGHLLLVCFNPWSAHGLWSIVSRFFPAAIWRQRRIGKVRIDDWLSLLGFKLQSVNYGYTIPPSGRAWFDKYGERLDKFCSKKNFPLGGVQVYHAISEVAAITPIRPRWNPVRAQLIGFGASSATVSSAKSR